MSTFAERSQGLASLRGPQEENRRLQRVLSPPRAHDQQGHEETPLGSHLGRDKAPDRY